MKDERLVEAERLEAQAQTLRLEFRNDQRAVLKRELEDWSLRAQQVMQPREIHRGSGWMANDELQSMVDDLLTHLDEFL